MKSIILPRYLRWSIAAGLAWAALFGGAAGAEVVRTEANVPVEVSFTAKKDHAALLEATAGVASDREELRLVLIGSGPLEDQLRRTAQSLGIARRVTFAGSRDDVVTSATSRPTIILITFS